MLELEEEARRLIDQCSNWGRWGEDDELGTLNYITQGEAVNSRSPRDGRTSVFDWQGSVDRCVAKEPSSTRASDAV